jgi:hypothetical protein
LSDKTRILKYVEDSNILGERYVKFHFQFEILNLLEQIYQEKETLVKD